MAGEAQADAGLQIEIVAKKQFDVWGMLPSNMPLVFVLVGLFLLGGIRDALCLLLIYIAFMSFCFFFRRYAEFPRALFDREGVTLLSGGVGRLRGRPIHFRWDVILEVRRPLLWMDGPIRFRLNRPRKFWTFGSQQQNTILIPKSIFANSQFAEALRAYVSPERIHADLAGDERLSWSARYWWILVLVILVCAAVVAGCSLVIIRKGFSTEPFITETLTLLIGALAMTLCAGRAPAAFRLVPSLLITFMFLLPFSIGLTFFFPGGLRLNAGCQGAAAGAMVGGALMVINGKNSRTGRFAGATFILAAAGFWCGWTGFHQVTAVRIGFGNLNYSDPWTPKGDAFLMTEGAYPGNSDKPTTECWYSADLALERRVVLPGSAHPLAVGQEAALFSVFGEPNEHLWFVPRRTVPRVIDEAPSFGNGMKSPDSRHALIAIWGEQREPLAWKICDLATGKIEPVNFPVPLKGISVIALRDDRTVLWLSGARPLDKGDNRTDYRTPLPESGEFPHPGKPYVVWSWKINSAESPVQLYAAKTQWLDWRPSVKPARLLVCRVSEQLPARVEYITLDFAQSPPAEAATSAQEFDATWRPLSGCSFDGRFEFEVNETHSFVPAFIVDTKTGRKFSMEPWAPLFGTAFIRWSPSANEFLIEITEWKLKGGLWCWHRSLENAFENSSVVYLVDMDRQ